MIFRPMGYPLEVNFEVNQLQEHRSHSLQQFEGDPDPAANQGGDGVVSGQGHLGGDQGEEGPEGDPSTAGDPFSVRTVPGIL